MRCPIPSRANVMLTAVMLEDEAIQRNSDILELVTDIDYASLDANGMEDACYDRLGYTCDSFRFDNRGFTATSSLDEDILMFFSVPWDSGWTATVNGEPAVIERQTWALWRCGYPPATPPSALTT